MNIYFLMSKYKIEKGKYEKDPRYFTQIQACMAAVLCIHLPALVLLPGADSDP